MLQASLIEGGAEFVGELISGSVLNTHLKSWVAGHETAIESAFAKDMDNTDLSAWLYNGVGTPEEPSDLGYWIGYHIAKGFYDNTTDKKEALRRLMQAVDEPKAIFAESGWKPRA